MNLRQTLAIVVVLIVVGVVARLVPHLPNFAPVTATALFCGAYMSRRNSLLALGAIMLVSDYLLLYINPYGRTSFGHFYMPWELWHNTIVYIYLAFGISALAGWLVGSRRNGGIVILATLFCSVQFFLVSNAGVWLAGAYDRGLDGLWQSYVAGLPFFRGTVLGDLFYTCAFFGGFELLRGAVEGLRDERVKLPMTR